MANKLLAGNKLLASESVGSLEIENPKVGLIGFQIPAWEMTNPLLGCKIGVGIHQSCVGFRAKYLRFCDHVAGTAKCLRSYGRDQAQRTSRFNPGSLLLSEPFCR